MQLLSKAHHDLKALGRSWRYARGGAGFTSRDCPRPNRTGCRSRQDLEGEGQRAGLPSPKNRWHTTCQAGCEKQRDLPRWSRALPLSSASEIAQLQTLRSEFLSPLSNQLERELSAWSNQQRANNCACEKVQPDKHFPTAVRLFAILIGDV